MTWNIQDGLEEYSNVQIELIVASSCPRYKTRRQGTQGRRTKRPNRPFTIRGPVRCVGQCIHLYAEQIAAVCSHAFLVGAQQTVSPTLIGASRHRPLETFNRDRTKHYLVDACQTPRIRLSCTNEASETDPDARKRQIALRALDEKGWHLLTPRPRQRRTLVHCVGRTARKSSAER
jgi:hypothetical protein